MFNGLIFDRFEKIRIYIRLCNYPVKIVGKFNEFTQLQSTNKYNKIINMRLQIIFNITT